jgi:hypothetical protein
MTKKPKKYWFTYLWGILGIIFLIILSNYFFIFSGLSFNEIYLYFGFAFMIWFIGLLFQYIW